MLVLVTVLPAMASDQDKARKELDKITAMAADATGRRIVNSSMAQTLNAKRFDLLMERRNHNINYGSLFLMHQLAANGAKLDDISARLKSGKNIYQIADEQKVDWKKVAEQAKSMNEKIDKDLFDHFAGTTPAAEKKQDEDDNYNIIYDGVQADNDVSKDAIERAGERYQNIRARAEAGNRHANGLSTTDRNAAYRDNVRSAGPQGGGGSGGAAPAAGGIR
jgi:hypothetical protein